MLTSTEESGGDSKTVVRHWAGLVNWINITGWLSID
jgi:hypothetical protein